jgi:hypothetical protein
MSGSKTGSASVGRPNRKSLQKGRIAGVRSPSTRAGPWQCLLRQRNLRRGHATPAPCGVGFPSIEVAYPPPPRSPPRLRRQPRRSAACDAATSPRIPRRASSPRFASQPGHAGVDSSPRSGSSAPAARRASAGQRSRTAVSATSRLRRSIGQRKMLLSGPGRGCSFPVPGGDADITAFRAAIRADYVRSAAGRRLNLGSRLNYASASRTVCEASGRLNPYRGRDRARHWCWLSEPVG